MLGAMTSLTGGGGLKGGTAGPATSGSKNNSTFNGGNINSGMQTKDLMIIAVVGLVALYVVKKL